MNCEIFADDTSLHALGINSATGQIKPQKCINIVSDWCDKNVMILHPAKQKVCYLLPDKNVSFARLSLILVSKTVTLSKFMSTDTLTLSSTMNLVSDPTLLARAKEYQKILYLLSQLKHFVDTFKRKLFCHAHISPT